MQDGEDESSEAAVLCHPQPQGCTEDVSTEWGSDLEQYSSTASSWSPAGPAGMG